MASAGPEKPPQPASSGGARVRIEPRGKTKAAQPKSWSFPTGQARVDPLAEAVAYALRQGGSDIPAETLARSVALPPEGLLTPALAMEAVRRQDGSARLVKAKLEELTAAVLPAVLFLKGHAVCVAQGRAADGTLQFWWPYGDGPDDISEIYTGVALLLRPAPQRPASQIDAPAPRGHWFWSTITRFWPDYFQVILASALVNLFALVLPVFTLNVYDRVFPNAALITLWSLVAGVGIALLFDAGLKLLRSRIVDSVGRRVDLNVSSRIFRHVLALDMEASPATAGGMVNTLRDFDHVREVFSSQTVATLTDLVFAGLFIALIAYLGGPLVWPPVIATLVIVVTMLLLIIPMRRRAAEGRGRGNVKSAVAVETLGALETVRASAGGARMLRRWEDAVTGAAVSNEDSRKLSNIAATLTASASQASSVGIVVLGVYLALEGDLTMGAVIATMILSGRALAPLAALSALMVRLSFAIDALGGLERVMALPARASQGGLNTPVQSGEIKLEEASLSYGPEGPKVLGPISLTLQAGSSVGVIGPVGSGKTSVLRLMAGLWQPSEGSVLLDGVNASQIAPDPLRSSVQMVPQDAVLFTGTLAENIAFGQPWARDVEVAEAAALAGVDVLAAAHPDGFGMMLAERGANLSGGQRHMVAIARALLSRPKVLILDEPTAAMDQETERRFVTQLGRLQQTRGLTLVIATHRSSLLDVVDRVLLLDQGKLARDGSKADVLGVLKTSGAQR